MIPMPLTGPNGVTYAHRCGNCGNVFGALTVPNDDAGLHCAERCCTCLSCGSPAGLARAYCALCDQKKREEWEDRQRQREENRARNLTASPNPSAALELEHVMSRFSENNWRAGWLIGLGETLWSWMNEHIHGARTSDKNLLSPEEAKQLHTLHVACGGWWEYDNFLTTEQWIAQGRKESDV